MAVKGGDIIHVANDVALIDRLQTAGPGSVNIRREQVYELGNYRAVGQVTDIPDLQFTMESQDVTPEMEAFLLDVPVATTPVFDLSKCKVVNVKSAFKPGKSAANAYDTVASAAIPGLRLEQMQYRFGVGNTNARQTATLRGDSLYYSPGSSYIQRVAGTNTANQQIVLDNDAIEVVEGGVTRRTLAVTTGQRRLFYEVDYTETIGTVTGAGAATTVTILEPVPTDEMISVVYSSPAVEAFPQSVHALVASTTGTVSSASGSSVTVSSAADVGPGTTLILSAGTANEEVVVVQSIAGSTATLVAPLVNAHADGSTFAVYAPSVKPAAIRGRDIDIFIGPGHAPGTSASVSRGPKRGGVQAADVDWRVQLEQDEEMGNHHFVDIDYDTPTVSGSLTFRPGTPQAMHALLRDLAGETTGVRAVGSMDAPLLDIQIALKNPADGRVLKRLHIPDARFSLAGYSARVQQRLDLQAPFQSDQGILYVYPG